MNIIAMVYGLKARVVSWLVRESKVKVKSFTDAPSTSPQLQLVLKEGGLGHVLPMDSADTNKHFDSGELDIKESAGWFGGWWNYRWCQTSMSILRAAEKRILSYIKTPYRGRYVNVGTVVGKDESKVWTLSLNETAERTPLVLLHGLGAGVALWALNLDGLASSRPVYAFDLLGFGRSSRPHFSNDAMEVERELVNSIEEWRREMNLERFALLGHSMGGFLATSYAIRFPNRVSHLILADPWGFPERPTDPSSRYPIPIWVKAIAYVLQPLNPLWGIRLAGPMGPKLIEKARPDLIKRYSVLTETEDGDAELEIANYIFHCNAQSPTGESAFHAMMSNFGWAKFPMCNRISALNKEVPLTMIYGSRSWVDHSPSDIIKSIRSESYVDVQVIHGAGHHVYADKKENFNQIVLKACEKADEMDGLAQGPPSTAEEAIELEMSPVSDRDPDPAPATALELDMTPVSDRDPDQAPAAESNPKPATDSKELKN